MRWSDGTIRVMQLQAQKGNPLAKHLLEKIRQEEKLRSEPSEPRTPAGPIDGAPKPGEINRSEREASNSPKSQEGQEQNSPKTEKPKPYSGNVRDFYDPESPDDIPF